MYLKLIINTNNKFNFDKKRDNKSLITSKLGLYIQKMICVCYPSFKTSKDNLAADNFLICVSDNYPTLHQFECIWSKF
jgi:hypothetical protein